MRTSVLKDEVYMLPFLPYSIVNEPSPKELPSLHLDDASNLFAGTTKSKVYIASRRLGKLRGFSSFAEEAAVFCGAECIQTYMTGAKYKADKGKIQTAQILVEVEGIEPTTSSLQSWRSPN